MSKNIIGILILVIGFILLIKPAIYNRDIWKKGPASRVALSPKQNRTYTRILGALGIIVGLFIILKK